MLTPPSRLVLAYVGTAHLALLAAAVLALVSANEVAASYVHPRTLGIVHFVTLGWLTATALGAVHALMPMILRTRFTVRWPDVVACIAVLVGASGVIAHMLLATYSGVAWSGGTIALGAAWVGSRCVLALAKAAGPRLQKLAVGLAFAGLIAAAGLGSLVAIDRGQPVFPGGHLHTLAAHAHLALVGWLGILTVGIGHRLLPMLLPASPLEGTRPAWTVGLLALGAGALPTTWLLVPWPSKVPILAAIPLVLGAACFALDLLALRARRKPKAKGLPRRDPALLLIGFSVLCMLAAAGLGITLMLVDLEPGIAALYGVLLLVGGLGGIVLGVGLRLWPIYAWMRVFARTAIVPGVPPGELPSYPLQWTAVLAWITAVIGLGLGMARHDSVAVLAGAASWTLASAATCMNLWLVLSRARRALPTGHTRVP